jgi:hypothetical protein
VSYLGFHRAAKLSPCGVYRYSLERGWSARPWLTVIMLNPSTADAMVDDPTIRRCVGFAQRDDFGGIHVVNRYALRATNPAALQIAPDPVGPDNEKAIRHAVGAARAGGGLILCAWGTKGSSDVTGLLRLFREERAVELLRCLGVTKEGHPRHPLYVRGDQPFEPWPPQAEREAA